MCGKSVLARGSWWDTVFMFCVRQWWLIERKWWIKPQWFQGLLCFSLGRCSEKLIDGTLAHSKRSAAMSERRSLFTHNGWNHMVPKSSIPSTRFSSTSKFVWNCSILPQSGRDLVMSGCQRYYAKPRARSVLAGTSCVSDYSAAVGPLRQEYLNHYIGLQTLYHITSGGLREWCHGATYERRHVTENSSKSRCDNMMLRSA